MTTPYRTDKQALLDKKAQIEREIDELRTQTESLEEKRARQVFLAQELSDIDARLHTKRALPLLDRIAVASPCPAKWDEMVGDAQTRFCLSCEKSVFNVSAMPRAAAESFLQEKLGGDICVRFYQRADGTIMTSDCAVGVAKKRRKKWVLAAAGASAAAIAAFTSLRAATNDDCPTRMGKISMGQMQVVPIQGTASVVAPPPPEASSGEWIGGAVIKRPAQEPAAHPSSKLPTGLPRNRE